MCSRTVLPALSSWRRGRREREVLDSWRYSVAWRPRSDPPATVLPGTWLLVGPVGADSATDTLAGGTDGASEPAMRIARVLEGQGARVVRITAADAGGWEPDRFARRLREAAGDADVRGVLSLLAMDEAQSPCPAGGMTGVTGTLILLQALVEAGVDARLWTVTRGGVSAGAADPLPNPAQAQVWGLGQVAALEQPDLWGGLIDLPRTVDGRALDRLARLLGGPGGEDQLAIRDAGVLVRRLVRAPLGRARAVREWRSSGTVLVTGGAEGMGAHVARWLARTGAEHLLLTTGQDLDAGRAAVLESELETLGAQVMLVPCDPADRGALAKVIAAIPGDQPLTAVIHTAELLDEGPLGEFSLDRLDQVLRAKAVAAWNLHELTRDLDLSAFVLFSSAAGTFGGIPGLGGYAAANAFLDALAEYRRGRGLPATSPAWGAWAVSDGEPGAVSDGERGAFPAAAAGEKPSFEAVRRRRLDRRGMPVIAPELAISALQQVLNHDETTVVVADVDWARFLPLFAISRPSPLLSELPEAHRLERAGGTAGRAPAAPLRLADLDTAEQRRMLPDLVRGEIAAVLAHASPESVELRRGFLELGLDSLTIVELRNRLNTATGLRLPARAILDSGTPEALVRRLRLELSDPAPSGVASSGAAEPGPDSEFARGEEPANVLSALFLRAGQFGRTAEFMDLLGTAAQFRPTFDTPDLHEMPELVDLAPGGREPGLICFPAVLATSGPHQYARLAAHLGDLGVSAVSLPGFRSGERLPATLDALVDAVAETLRDRTAGAPFALAGYSSGGLVAHAVARRLESVGVLPEAVVLIDTYRLDGAALSLLSPAIIGGMAERIGELTPLDDIRLTAMGGYLRLVTNREPPEVKAPTLLVRATQPVAGLAERAEVPPSWNQPHELAEVPGDHFSLIEEDAHSTALVVREWLTAALARR